MSDVQDGATDQRGGSNKKVRFVKDCLTLLM